MFLLRIFLCCPSVFYTLVTIEVSKIFFVVFINCDSAGVLFCYFFRKHCHVTHNSCGIASFYSKHISLYPCSSHALKVVSSRPVLFRKSLKIKIKIVFSSALRTTAVSYVVLRNLIRALWISS